MQISFQGRAVGWLATGLIGVCLASSVGAAPAFRHWEIASPDPDRIFLCFSGDPTARRAVSWRTSPEVGPGSAVAEIAPATAGPSFDAGLKEVAAETVALDLNTSSYNKQGVVHYHSAVFKGLRPDTLYAYRVGSQSGVGGGRWSEWIQFRTAKRERAPFEFVYFGDAQNDVLSRWSRVIRMAYATAPEAAFALHCGDLVNRAHSDNEWAQWFKSGGWAHSSWTGVPALGNHEYSLLHPSNSRPKGVTPQRAVSLQWRAQFALPEVAGLSEELQETVYHFDYQGARVVVLNSNFGVEEQVAYLDRVLAASTANWNIVAFHHSVFAPAKNRDATPLRNALKPILDKHSVDLVLQGHDHVYSRGHTPVRQLEDERQEAFQTMYVTSVSGPKMYSIPEGKLEGYRKHGFRPGTSAVQKQFFQVIRVDGGALTYRAYTADGKLFDSATIRKDFETGAKVLEP